MSNVEDIIKLINATKCEEEPKKKFQSYILIYTNVAWVIVLLVVILCILLSVDLTNLESNRIIFYIANFATLLSIILSISSILFAYFTSRDTQTQYVAMGKALEEVRAINFQIMISNSGLVSQVNDIAKDVSVLNNKYDIYATLNRLSTSNLINSMELIGNEIPKNDIKNMP